MDEERLTLADVSQWLEITPEQVKQLRRGRDATRFPPPLLGGAGLAWYEQDICDWVSFVADWIDAGATREALAELDPPVYLSVEPEIKKESYR